MQQAAHVTGGIYLKPKHPAALLQYLQVGVMCCWHCTRPAGSAPVDAVEPHKSFSMMLQSMAPACALLPHLRPNSAMAVPADLFCS